MKIKLIFAVIGILFAFSSCTQNTKTDILIESGEDPKKVKVYREYMKNLSKEIEDNQPNYKHLPLTKKGDYDWFYIETYALWGKNISRVQFIQNGVHKYPEHRKSLEYLADQLTE